VLFPCNLFSQSLQFLLLLSCELVHGRVDVLDLGKFFILNGLLFFKLFKAFLFLFDSKFDLIQPCIEFLVLLIEIFPQGFVCDLLRPGIVELKFNNLKFFFFEFLVLLFTFDLDFLLSFFLYQFIILKLEFGLKFFVIRNSLLYLGQLCLVRLKRNGEKLFLFLKLFISNGIFAHRGNPPFVYRLILLHHCMQSFHLGFKFLYLLF
jgi:hypothetical protein